MPTLSAIASRRRFLAEGAALAAAAALPLRVQAEAPTPTPSDVFAAGLVREVVAAKPEGNVVVSPFSVQGALALAAIGARGASRERLQAVLGLPDLAPAALHDWFATPLLEATRAAFVRRAAIDPHYREAIARALAAQVRSMPDDPRRAARAVNAWADGATHHRIRDIVDSVSPDVPLLLADAVYLNFQWNDPFKTSATRPEPFHRTPDSTVHVPMMRQRLQTVAGPVEVGTAVYLRFAGEDDVGMHLVLPRDGLSAEDALDAVLRAPEMLVANATPTFTRQQVDLSLPSFAIRSEASFVPALQRVGLASLFAQADFSGISPALRDARIGDVVQKAWMRVDETGVEAAAVTVATTLVFAMRGASPPPPLRIVFDRPFALVIRDKATLFAALVRDPVPA